MTATVPAGDPGALLNRLEEAHYNDDGECRGCREDCLYCEADHPWPCRFADLIRLARDGLALRDAVLALAEELANKGKVFRPSGRGAEVQVAYAHNLADRLDRLVADTTGEASR